MNNRILFTVLFALLPALGFNQLNDTIFYKSGSIKIVEITSFTTENIFYKASPNSAESSISQTTVSSFKMYDNEGVLTYDSGNIGGNTQAEPDPEREMVKNELAVSVHKLSINPFLLTFLTPNLKYNYTFGDKMQYSITSRVTYISELLDEFNIYGDLMLGAGFRLNPFYTKHFAFGIDLTPMVGLYTNATVTGTNADPVFMFPLNVNFDIFFNDRLGISIDSGLGTAYSSGDYNYMGRFHIGLLWQFKTKKTIEKP